MTDGCLIEFHRLIAVKEVKILSNYSILDSDPTANRQQQKQMSENQIVTLFPHLTSSSSRAFIYLTNKTRQNKTPNTR
jgi:hypothetical protein